jgi:hypothetical protein
MNPTDRTERLKDKIPSVLSGKEFDLQNLVQSITPTITPTATPTPTPTPTPTFIPGVVPPGAIQFYADYIVLSYEFTDGADLDTVTTVIGTNVSGIGQSVGYGRGSVVSDWMTWGGDNTGNGIEAVLLNINQIRSTYPSVTDISIDCQAHWYRTPGVNPVNMRAVMYREGTMIKSGFSWNNTTAAATTNLASFSSAIVNRYNNPQRVAVFQYNIPTNIGRFVSGN